MRTHGTREVRAAEVARRERFEEDTIADVADVVLSLVLFVVAVVVREGEHRKSTTSYLA